ncbi:MAG: SIR2 family protein [Chlorobium sp.]|jgi:hypothetical protein|nr:SIR2 family protein [Chlorobium sp.]
MLDLSALRTALDANTGFVVDSQVLDYVLESINKDLAPIENDADAWRKFSMLWPPRLVHAYRNRHLIPFFGSGVSIAAGLPSWNSLLVDNFGLSSEFIEDKELQNDPLTLAELAAQHVGIDKLQNTLHTRYGSVKKPTSTHVLLCSLRCPIYITTNYDVLFEEAWKLLNTGIKLHVVTNDLWVDGLPNSVAQIRNSNDQALLIKIHGSTDRPDEQLVLTRRDYRHHYRSNTKLFSLLGDLLSKEHVLFLGFSHRDPEVSRLVENAIFEYEKEQLKPTVSRSNDRPHFYSLQFNMMSHSPEVYAARGLVALLPPTLKRTAVDSRSTALSLSMAELVLAGDQDTHSKIRLDDKLREFADQVGHPLEMALSVLEGFKNSALTKLSDSTSSDAWMDKLLVDLKELASQGVWLLNDAGVVQSYRVAAGQDSSKRGTKKSFSERPYFRQAKTYRKPFVSDTTMSTFNRNSTFFICFPLMSANGFAGLLFAACQSGTWQVPFHIAKECWKDDLSFVLIDSNGIVIVPPNDEFSSSGNTGPEGANEDPLSNIGYSFENILSLSRRDFLVSHVARNIVPLSQDDDIATVSSDLRIYSAITEVRSTRWKLCLSRTIVNLDIF